ncbi:MAG: maleamate amidohydrolase [Solirubrobacteraceae bacterium]|nr:maleamate amidohydrolase [Solirubrobacteraceae bacterium]
MNADLDRLAREHLAELHERLSAKGFAGRVGFGSRPAVLVVDLINGFTDERSPLASNLDDEVENTRRVLEAARAAGAPVIMSTVSYDEALDEAGLWSLKVPNNGWLVEGSEWVQIDERLQRRPGDMLLVKKYASCFFGTDLMSRLVSRQVDTLVITGCTTSGCVRASAVDSCSYGLRTIVVEDAVGDRAPLSHLTCLFDIDAKYGDVVSTDAAVSYLESVTSSASR